VTAFEGPRRRLIETLREQGIDDLAVLRAFDLVPRHLFVPDALRHQAYRDAALPIGCGQTISRPFTHALALQALDLAGRERVLEVGSGSGFQTALLAHLADHVYTIERIPELAARARRTLTTLGIRNVSARVGDGAGGWAEHAPFEAILVSARADEIASAWLEQLAPEGRLVVPLGPPETQELVQVRRDRRGRLRRRSLGVARFVSLVQRRGRGERG
jgi:protein-L-isoaspartate(D-aspartate) O-methyltransferase